MASTVCKNGHLYDPRLNERCPYCSGESSVVDFTGGSYREGQERDLHLAGTVAPAMDFRDNSYNERPNKTTAPGVSGANSHDFSYPEDKIIGRREGNSGITVAPERKNGVKTVGVFQGKYNFEPVVGWLACIEGASKGRSYQIYAKINSVGRGAEADICIKGDMSVSEKHAKIAYEYKHNSFHLIPGDSSNNIYLNDQPIYSAEKLNGFDTIELGNTTLIFVPLCCDRFEWKMERKTEETS